MSVKISDLTEAASVASTDYVVVDNGLATKKATVNKLFDRGLPYTTTAPTEANLDGLKIAVLSSVPATKYSGWLYIIAVNTSQMTIGSATYYFEVGSTWQQWLGSTFNTAGFVNSYNYIKTSDLQYVVQLSGSAVNPSDTIQATTYTLSGK